MLPEDADNAYLWDMLDAAGAVQQFVEGKTFKGYIDDRMMRGAVERHERYKAALAGRLIYL